MLVIRKVTLQNKEYEIVVSDDAQELLLKQKEGAIVIYLEREGSYAYQFPYVIQELEALEDEEYLMDVVYRTLGIPKTILSFEKYILRELGEKDVKDLLVLYKENEGNASVEPFFKTEEEGMVYIRDYKNGVYALDRDGIYGIFLKEILGQEVFVGLAGFTEKEEGKELSYALLARYQKQGIMEKVCQRLLEQQKGRVFVRVQKGNERAIHLAEKLGIETLCTGP
ncbi:MAG: GNAT family N-acetyltransferase [Lachnospiraceae bacterium]|nr:GNAT family N-acetyltransferase [Lachnospiraceae bacterium]